MAFYVRPNWKLNPKKLRPFHCKNCDVSWKDHVKAPFSNCWGCGRFGEKGSHPDVHYKVRRAGPDTKPSWRSIAGVHICNWDALPKHYRENEDGEIEVVVDD